MVVNVKVKASWNVMSHVQKTDFVFRRNGRVHLNRRGRQFSRLLAAELCASAVVMLHIPCSEVAWEYWLPTAFASFPLTSLPVRHRVPSHFNWSLPCAGFGLSAGLAVLKLNYRHLVRTYWHFQTHAIYNIHFHLFMNILTTSHTYVSYISERCHHVHSTWTRCSAQIVVSIFYILT